jgi:hypothetical protein
MDHLACNVTLILVFLYTYFEDILTDTQVPSLLDQFEQSMNNKMNTYI